MNVTIRQDESLEEILLCDSLIFPGEEMDPEEAKKFRWWTARVKSTGEIAAYGALWLVPDLDGEVVAYLCRFGTMPLARGNRLQQKLIRCILNHAKRKGCKTAITYTMPWNHASSNSFIRQGFTLYEPEYAHVGTGVLYWRREL